MKTIALLILGVAILLNTSNAAICSTYQGDLDALQVVDTSNGIDQAEAYIIAKSFFWLNISGCGFPDEPKSDNGNWVSETRIGYAGTPGPPITINKMTGTISWGDPKNSMPLEELKRSKSNQKMKADEK